MAENELDLNPKRNMKVIAVAFIIIGIGIIVYLMLNNPGSDARDDYVSIDEINQQSQTQTVVLYFWSETCSYCTDQKPIIDDLESDLKNSNVTFYWFNARNHEDLTEYYDVYGVPTTIVINQNGILKKFEGYYEYDSLINSIENSIDSYE